MIGRVLNALRNACQAEYWKLLAARGTPIPFEYKNRRYYANPELGAGYHIRHSTDKIARMCDLIDRPPAVVFDVGANCGLFSAFVSQKFPESRTFAFEPSSDLIPIIRLNCALPSVTICEYAVGSINGNQVLFVNPESQQTNSINREAVELFAKSNTLKELVVPCRTLDSVAEEYAIDRVDVLKVDVQGFEGEVFRGATRILPGVNHLFVESTWIDIESIVQLIPFAIKAGFTHAVVINPVYMGADILFSREPVSIDSVANSRSVRLSEGLLAGRWN